MQSCGNTREMHINQRRWWGRAWKWEWELQLELELSGDSGGDHLLNCALINHRHRTITPFVVTYFYTKAAEIERDEKIYANLCTFHGQQRQRKKWFVNLSSRVNLIHFIKCFSANHLTAIFCWPAYCEAILRIRHAAHTANDSIKSSEKVFEWKWIRRLGVNWSMQRVKRISEINLNKLFGHKQKVCIVNKSM